MRSISSLAFTHTVKVVKRYANQESAMFDRKSNALEVEVTNDKIRIGRFLEGRKIALANFSGIIIDPDCRHMCRF